jgi:hypothetical protein
MYLPRPRCLRFASIARFSVVLAAIGIHAQADAVTMITDNAIGESWVTAGDWSDSLAAHPGADYVVGANFLLRTPTANSNTFPGDSLTLSGQFNLASTSGTTTTVNNLTLSNGVIVNAITGSTQSLNGTLQFGFGASFIKSTGTTETTSPGGGARNIIVDSLISGGEQATAHFLRHGAFTLTNPNNNFGGIWQAGGTGIVISGGNPSPGYTVNNNANNISTLKATLSGSLGVDASVVLDLWSRFDIDYDWTTTGSLTLENNGGFSNSILMTLDQNITVGTLSIAGSSLNPATYSYNDLSLAGYGDYFTNSGGSITVIPEPSAVGLMGVGGFGTILLFSRRRRLPV